MTAAQQEKIESIGTGSVELGRYRLGAEGRVLVGRRTAEGTEIDDLSLAGGARFRVDAGLHDPAAIAALVEDYLAQALRLDLPPMSPEAIGSMLADSEGDSLAPLLGED